LIEYPVRLEDTRLPYTPAARWRVQRPSNAGLKKAQPVYLVWRIALRVFDEVHQMYGGVRIERTRQATASRAVAFCGSTRSDFRCDAFLTLLGPGAMSEAASPGSENAMDGPRRRRRNGNRIEQRSA
jgi:hypothetical protein